MEKRFDHPKKYVKRILFRLKEWNKLITVSLGLVFIFTILVVVVVETYCQNVNSADFEDNTTVPEVDNFREDEVNYCFLENKIECIVECNNIEDVNIPSTINELDLSACSSQELTLTLNVVYFTNTTITKGWLQDLRRDIVYLTITSPSLTDIAESSFSGKPFENLQKLVITDSRIKFLRKDAFKDVKLQTFEFRCITNANLKVEFNALEYVSDYLTILQFSQCIEDFTAVRNVTGTKDSIFNKLLEIDLSYNSFTIVLNNSFVDAPQIRSLYLFGNNIKSIEVNSFSGIGNSLQLLSLKNNKLKTLPEGVFQGFTRGGQIDIVDNPWECNCSLLWFKEYYIQNLDFYFKNGTIPFQCTAGDYLEVNFCDEDSTSVENTTPASSETTTVVPEVTPPITTPPTESPDDYLYLNCTDIREYKGSLQDNLNRLYSHTVKVRNGSITYQFYQIEGTPYFEIKLKNNVGSDYMIWINSKNSSDYGCVTNIQETVILSNLHYGSTYTICLMKQSEETVTPFDCTSLTVPLEWKNGPWIINKYMPAVIGGVVGITLALIVVTTVITFYTIRQHPKLIKGNKRVVIVRNKSADALVMPNYEKQQYVPPSIYTNSEGYLTPRNKMYEKINERRFRPLNTITEKFYQDFNTSTRSTTNYTGFLHRKSVGSEVYEPPPLPPNHPSERPCSSTQSTIYKRRYKNSM